MSHNPSHTLLRNGSFYYNRRVPNSLACAFGHRHIRLRLSRERDEAEALSKALSNRLEELWAADVVKPVELEALLKAVQPRQLELQQCLL